MKAAFNHQRFDFVFLQGNQLQPLQSDFSASEYEKVELPGNALLFISRNDPWRRLSRANGDEYIFIGDVFYFDAFRPEKSDGHFVGLRISQGGEVCFFRNRNSHIGVYYANGIVFSSLYRTQRRLRRIRNIDLSDEALADFFHYGFVSFGQTPFKQISQLPFQKRLLLKEGRFSLTGEESLSVIDEVLTDPKALYDFFQERFSLWLNHATYRSVAVSGGLDSRFIVSCLLDKKIQRDMTLHSRLHPNLTEEEDRDVLLAKRIAALTPFPHAIQKATDLPTAFLSQEPPCRPTVLSGLYGGEYVGGEFLYQVDLSTFDEDRAKDDGVFAEQVRLHKPATTYQNDVRFKIGVFAQTSLCNVYDGAWASIGMHHNITLTPFWDSYCVEVLMSLPAAELKNYGLYRRLYSYFPENLRRVPLNSHMQIYHEDYLIATDGQNPKHVPLTTAPRSPSQKTMDLLPTRLKQSAVNEVQLRGFETFLNLAGDL